MPVCALNMYFGRKCQAGYMPRGSQFHAQRRVFSCFWIGPPNLDSKHILDMSQRLIWLKQPHCMDIVEIVHAGWLRPECWHLVVYTVNELFSRLMVT